MSVSFKSLHETFKARHFSEKTGNTRDPLSFSIFMVSPSDMFVENVTRLLVY